jgi:hypothetical protein
MEHQSATSLHAASFLAASFLASFLGCTLPRCTSLRTPASVPVLAPLLCSLPIHTQHSALPSVCLCCAPSSTSTLHCCAPTPPPDPSLIPAQADTVTQQVRAVRPLSCNHSLRDLPLNSFTRATPIRTKARLLSLQRWNAGAYLGTVPINMYLCMPDGNLISGYHFLHATGINPYIPATTCACGCHIQGSNIDHAMSLCGSHLRTEGRFSAASLIA